MKLAHRVGPFATPWGFHGVRAVLLPAELKWQVHAHHTSLLCPSPENTHLALTEVSIMAEVELISLCVVRGININHRNFGVLWHELLAWILKHIVSFSSVASLRVWTVLNQLPKENMHPSCFPKWVWEWNTLAFKGWENRFYPLNVNGRVTPRIFLLCLTALEMHSWYKTNLHI